ncbi:MAG: glucose-6-phosphate dehydrogenase [Solirubrobacteraceae bacterium]
MTSTSVPPESLSHDAVRTPDPHVIVLFGATGDLAKRKLLPGLLHLLCSGLAPERLRIVGTSTSVLSDEQFRELACASVQEFGKEDLVGDAWERFAPLLSFATSGTEGDSGAVLAARVREAEQEIGGEARLLHFLSVPPKATPAIIRELGVNELVDRARVVLEKPFGTDLASARARNATVHEVFREDQVFRIDHLLGKEAVQNILALRFANGRFEPIWNRDHVASVQIDVPEKLSVGTRAGFYEGTGAYRDMVVTHLFQVLGFLAMEPPTSLEPKTLADEKAKVFEALRPLDPDAVVRGQYDGYRDVDGVAPDSETETFVALRAEVENWRWQGVPFFLRTGKCLAAGQRVVTIMLREPALQMFRHGSGVHDAHPNALLFDLGDPGSITAEFLAKEPGATMRIASARMTFSYEQSFQAANQLEAYERLIHDVMIGDRMLFNRADGIERLWEISTPLLEDPPPIHAYAPGSSGPAEADALVAPGRWHLSEDQ